MRGTSGPVYRALDRWVRKGLLTPLRAEALRKEVEEASRGETVQWTQFALAATGGAVLIIAGGTFLAWAWPAMDPGGQSLTLALVGLLVFGLGLVLLHRKRWPPVAYLLALAGPFLVLMAGAYSENAWADGSLGGVASGLAVLALSILCIALFLGRDDTLTALNSVLAFLFLFVFLDRVFGLEPETILWILDGVLVLGLAGLAGLALKLSDPGASEWPLATFTAFLWAGGVLLLFSGAVVWDMEEYAIIPLDLWLVTVAGLSVWGLQEETGEVSPGVRRLRARREWWERQLAYCVLLAIPFAFITTLEALDTGPHPAAGSVAGVGVLGLAYGIPRRSRWVMVTSCLALLVSAWYYGAEMAGALGAVLTLAVVAVVLFWAAVRVGGGGGVGPMQDSARSRKERSV